MKWIYEQFHDLADVCELVPVPEDIVHDPCFAFRVNDTPYKERPNVRVVLKGAGAGKSVIFNAHADVVAALENQECSFEPKIKDGRMYGRGTCDDKAQIAVLWSICKAFKKLGIKPNGNVILHFVIEEVTGGNGTLAMMRRGEKADCSIILGPCSNNICTSVKGAVCFCGTFYGNSKNNGYPQVTVSALKLAEEAMRIIEEYHDELLAETINDNPLFARHRDPMPVTFGQLTAGDWESSVPQKAVLKGVFGLLTTPKEQAMKEIKERIKTRGSEWLSTNFDMMYRYCHDASIIDPGLPFVQALTDSYRLMNVQSKTDVMTASTDAWFYTNVLGIPGLMTGCGDLCNAYSCCENVALEGLTMESAVLTQFIKEWCGIRES
ncbi:MAG: M20/M25/M40 family metallo-hydrolase [Candidatus Latescibacteria bacterium]|nr:M20/M25/M40 family metallo-hydrolase [Candidatus Latescibacterota bacterium]